MTTADDNNTQEASSAQRMVGDEPQARNIDLGKSAITPLIRVSSAALYREERWGRWWLVETWIFSDDPRQRTRQIIHGDCSAGGGGPPPERICATARKVHGQIAENLRRRFANVELVAAKPCAVDTCPKCGGLDWYQVGNLRCCFRCAGGFIVGSGEAATGALTNGGTAQ